MAHEILNLSLAEARATHTSVKWTAFGPEVIPLWVAEMDVQPAPAVADALAARS